MLCDLHGVVTIAERTNLDFEEAAGLVDVRFESSTPELVRTGRRVLAPEKRADLHAVDYPAGRSGLWRLGLWSWGRPRRRGWLRRRSRRGFGFGLVLRSRGGFRRLGLGRRDWGRRFGVWSRDGADGRPRRGRGRREKGAATNISDENRNGKETHDREGDDRKIRKR